MIILIGEGLKAFLVKGKYPTVKGVKSGNPVRIKRGTVEDDGTDFATLLQQRGFAVTSVALMQLPTGGPEKVFDYCFEVIWPGRKQYMAAFAASKEAAAKEPSAEQDPEPA